MDISFFLSSAKYGIWLKIKDLPRIICRNIHIVNLTKYLDFGSIPCGGYYIHIVKVLPEWVDIRF